MTTQLTWEAEDVVRAVHGQCLHEQTWRAHGVSIDSRAVRAGDLFIALKGPTHDGHDHVAAAINAGAIGAIVSRQPSQATPQTPLIFVDDTFTALELLGGAGRQRTEARIVAVTGSVGKTSSKEMLRFMLSTVGNTYANEGSLNNHWGVPLSLARLPAEARYGVFELGMNHAGELGPLSKQVSPDVALITTIEAVHLEFFASLESIADAKAEIFLGLKPDGAVILNRDNSQYARLAAAAKTHGLKKILGFGQDNKADARLLRYTPTPRGGEIKAEILGKHHHYQIGAPGLHSALNSLGALLAAVTAGGAVESCMAALESYKQPKGRGTIHTIALIDGALTLIDESYNASPASVRAAIGVLGYMTPAAGGRRILALGDMRELGPTAPTLHADLAEDITNNKIDLVFCCGEMMEHLYETLPAELHGVHAPDSAALADHIAREVRAGDIVTVKGSHSMHMDRVVQTLMRRSHGATNDKLAS